MKVYGYARLSRANEDSTSIRKQRDVIRKTAEARGWDLVDIATDESASATKTRLDRPGLTEARDAIARGDAEALLVWRLDRVARSVVDFGTLLDEGLNIVSATEPLDTTTPMGRAMVEILQVFASLEARTTGERLKGTKAYLKAQRRWGGGPRPYGYRPVKASDGVGKMLLIVDEEATVIRRIFGDLLAGVSVNGIARALNAEGIPTAKDREWTPASVLNIARALHVSGYLTEGTGDGSRNRRAVVDEHGEPVVAWPPIVDDETAEAVRALVTPEALDEARSAATKDGRKAPKRLLEGLAFCPCGKALIRRTRRGVAFYGCKGIAEGSHVLVDAEKTEAEAEAQFLAQFSGVEVVDVIRDVPTTGALAEVDRALAAASAEISRTATPDLPGLFSRIADLMAEKERLAATSDRVTTRRTFTPYGEAWGSWSTEERREHMSAVGVRVAIRAAARRGAWDPARVRLTADVDYLAGQLD